ncbi:CHAP domain-containing protein [Archangium sp.]|jgi:hypothetical protein|uniref:CHAP domain-containing protein n=1 Tax=Archangium sp. TaxID=1872627 RepID=UPI002EDAF896
MLYPGRLIQVGEADKQIVKAVQQRLNERRCGPLEADGDFGPKTQAAVMLFQSRTTDRDGVPLKVDGVLGALSWEVLFDGQVPVISQVDDELLARVLEVARAQLGVREEPKNSNRGKQVDEYLRSVGLDPTRGNYPWCCAFVYWCFQMAARDRNRENPMVKTAGCLDHWLKAGERKIRRLHVARAIADPGVVKPGMVFIMDFGEGKGHTGIVEQVNGGKLLTIEGNTDPSTGSREGGGVYRMNRKLTQMGRGFIDYAGA